MHNIPGVLNTYLYGSHIYKTNDNESDIDILIVTSHLPENDIQGVLGPLNYTLYSMQYFQNLIDEHDVLALECVFCPSTCRIESRVPYFNLSLDKLRKSFSSKASNSWVKAKKKIDLHQELRVGKKSLFHSLRILLFGIQIAEHGYITDYTAASQMWAEIKSQDFMTWEDYKKYWQKEYNRLHSEFKLKAPLKDDK